MSTTKSERKIIEKLKIIDGKVKCIHNNYLGQRQTMSIIKINNNYYIGRALCSNEDNFSRKVGRSISLGRAWLSYENKIVQHSMPEEYKFREDQIKKESE